MISVLAQPRLRRFFLAHLQSRLGTGAAYVALVLIAYQRLHESWAIALVLLADVLPGIVLSTVFGALADRVSRTRLAVTALLLSAGAFAGLAVVSSFVVTVALALVAGVGTAMFRPAVGAALPGLVGVGQRSAVTALYGTINNLGLTVGPALTALVLLFGTPALVLGINAAALVASAGVLCGVSLGAGSDTGDEDQEDCGTLWESTRAGIAATRRTRGVGVLIVIGASSVFFGAVINVAEPLLANGPLHAGKAGYSVLVSAYGAGMVLASLLCARAGNRVGLLRRLWLAGNALCATGMLASAAAPSLAWAAATFALTGAANALIISPEMRLFQEIVPARVLGRVLGFSDTATNVALLAAFVCAGGLLTQLSTRMVFALGAVALLLLTVVAALTFHPEPRREQPEPTDDGVPALGLIADVADAQRAYAGAY